MEIKNQCEKLIAVILTVSIIATSFSSVVQISAQTEGTLHSQVAQVTTSEYDRIQITANSSEPIKEFVIRSEGDFIEFMTRPVFWSSKYIKITLNCNIAMEGKAFKPIKEFGGVFDGCGHTISNLKIQDKSSKSKNSELAFITTLNEFAEIKNVTFDNYNFDNYNVEGNSGIKKAAGLVITNHGTISSVDIINSSVNNIDKEANAAGFVFSNEENGIIKNCHIENISTKEAMIKSGFIGTNLGKITNCSTTLSANSKGVVGGFISENSGIIEKCNSKGDVESEKCAGSFCGKNSGEIVSCKSEGSVKAKTKSTKVVTICGGFVGENSGIIKDCSSAGKVEGQEFTGGFVGINKDKGEICSCDFKGNVKSYTYTASICCGGFVGVDEGKIVDCAFKGTVNGHVDSEKIVKIGASIIATVAIVTILCLVVKYFKDKPKLVKQLLKNNNDNENLNELLRLNLDEFNKEISYKQSLTSLQSAINESANTAQREMIRRVIIEQQNISMRELIRECSVMVQSGYTTAMENVKTALSNWKAAKQAKNTFFRQFNVGKLFFKDSFVISLLTIGAFGCVVPSITMISTILNKCANVAGFCGLNAGEIIGCNANSSSIEVKTLSNDYNICGGFVGTNSGTIKDSDATGKEICNEKYTGGYLGGFVGDNSGKIENGTTTVPVTNGKYTGGFCGNNSGEISASRSEGNAKTNATTVKTKCGGFIGNNEKGIIDGCTSIGRATGQEYVGGFCGDNSGDILKSKSKGNAVAKTASNTNKCGGFVGANRGNIIDCSSKGSATGQEYVGGFVGVNNSDIIECNSTGKATAKTKNHTAVGGGFVGENEKGTIISCTSTGGADSQSSLGQAKSGGFVGINKASIIISQASGYVYLSAGTCHKDDGCGGFVGRNDKDGRIDGCYDECTIGTTNKKKGGGFVGEAVSKSTIMNSWCKAKIITKTGVKNQTKFYQDKDKKVIIESCYAN